MLYFPVEHPVDELHIQSAPHGIGQQVILLFLVRGGVEGPQPGEIRPLALTEGPKHRLRHAGAVEDAVEVGAVDGPAAR